MPSHACMPAMRSGVRNLFFANKSVQQHGSPAVHNVPQVRLSGTNRVAHLTIWNPTRLYDEHKHSPSHAILVENMSEAFGVCNEKLILHRLAMCCSELPAGSSISQSHPNTSLTHQFQDKSLPGLSWTTQTRVRYYILLLYSLLTVLNYYHILSYSLYAFYYYHILSYSLGSIFLSMYICLYSCLIL